MEGRDRLSDMDWDGVWELELYDASRGRYLRCFIHDVSAERGYFVSLDGYASEGKWMEKGRVFVKDPAPEEDMKPPEVGEKVEIRDNSGHSGDGVVAWRSGRVVDVIDGFYHVSFLGGSDEVVEFAMLREPNRRRPAMFTKEIVGVPEGVRQDILRTGHTLRELAQDLGLGELKVDATGDFIEMVGPREAMEGARQALSVHFLRVRRFAQLSGIHQALRQRWQDVNDLRETALELCFEVDHDVIGSCIGKAGVNLKKAHRVPGVVSVKVTDFQLPDGSQRHRFTIVAKDRKAAETAREVLEYVRIRMYVTREEIGPVIGKKGVHLREIEQKTGVSKFVLVEDITGSSLPYFETVGTRRGVETAKRLFNMHRGYLEKNRQIEDDIRKLRTNLAQVGVSGSVALDDLQTSIYEFDDRSCDFSRESNVGGSSGANSSGSLNGSERQSSLPSRKSSKRLSSASDNGHATSGPNNTQSHAHAQSHRRPSTSSNSSSKSNRPHRTRINHKNSSVQQQSS